MTAGNKENVPQQRAGRFLSNRCKKIFRQVNLIEINIVSAANDMACPEFICVVVMVIRKNMFLYRTGKRHLKQDHLPLSEPLGSDNNR